MTTMTRQLRKMSIMAKIKYEKDQVERRGEPFSIAMTYTTLPILVTSLID